MTIDGQTFALFYFKKEDTNDKVFSFSSRFGGHKVLVTQLCTPSPYVAAISTCPPLPTARTLVLHFQCESFSCPGLEAFHKIHILLLVHIKTLLFPCWASCTNTCFYVVYWSNIHTFALQYLGSKATFSRVTQATHVCFPAPTDILYALGSRSHLQPPPVYNSIIHDLFHFASCIATSISLILSTFPSLLCNLTYTHPVNCKDWGFLELLRYK